MSVFLVFYNLSWFFELLFLSFCFILFWTTMTLLASYFVDGPSVWVCLMFAQNEVELGIFVKNITEEIFCTSRFSTSGIHDESIAYYMKLTLILFQIISARLLYYTVISMFVTNIIMCVQTSPRSHFPWEVYAQILVSFYDLVYNNCYCGISIIVIFFFYFLSLLLTGILL
jgi:hypothetical protein